MAEPFLKVWKLLLPKIKEDDTFADRLNRRYTMGILLLWTPIVSLIYHLSVPIVCWAPAHFTKYQVKYTNSYCWVRNLYPLPYADHIPDEDDDKRHIITYYQWAPFILLCQACLFYLPYVLWRVLNSKSGVDVADIISYVKYTKFEKDVKKDAKKYDKYITECLDEKEEEKYKKNLFKQLDRFLGNPFAPASGCTVTLKHCFSRTVCRSCGRRFGNYLVTLSLTIKLLYIANLLAQILLMDRILGGPFSMYGIKKLMTLVRSEYNLQSHPRFFPRIAMCDMEIRRLGNVHRYTVQCVLPMNLYLEKTYLFLWFWMIFVVIVSCVDWMTWFLRGVMMVDSKAYVSSHLQSFGRLKKTGTNEKVEKFVTQYLKRDGIFLVRLIGYTCGTARAADVVCILWDNWVIKNILPYRQPLLGRNSWSHAKHVKVANTTSQITRLLDTNCADENNFAGD